MPTGLYLISALEKLVNMPLLISEISLPLTCACGLYQSYFTIMSMHHDMGFYFLLERLHKVKHCTVEILVYVNVGNRC